MSAQICHIRAGFSISDGMVSTVAVGVWVKSIAFLKAIESNLQVHWLIICNVTGNTLIMDEHIEMFTSTNRTLYDAPWYTWFGHAPPKTPVRWHVALQKIGIALSRENLLWIWCLINLTFNQISFISSSRRKSLIYTVLYLSLLCLKFWDYLKILGGHIKYLHFHML